MTDPSIFLLGSVASHRRGEVLQDAVGAEASGELSGGHGIALAFGTDFQDADEVIQSAWLAWSQAPGRTLVLLPPFSKGKCKAPIPWEALRHTDVPVQGALPLLRTLAPEVQYEIRGSLQVARHVGGVWEDFSVHTAYYRKHPHSGLFVVTSLPLWSLSVLDEQEQLAEWLRKLHELAGEPVVQPDDPESETPLESWHFTMLLHLLAGSYADDDSVLAALAKSPILQLDPDRARTALSALRDLNLVEGTKVTEEGRNRISGSPYAVYADALEARAQ
jgi:hypothetical protein